MPYVGYFSVIYLLYQSQAPAMLLQATCRVTTELARRHIGQPCRPRCSCFGGPWAGREKNRHRCASRKNCCGSMIHGAAIYGNIYHQYTPNIWKKHVPNHQSVYIYYTHDGSMVLVHMLTWLGYIDGIHVTIYSSTMDPSWVCLERFEHLICSK